MSLLITERERHNALNLPFSPPLRTQFGDVPRADADSVQKRAVFQYLDDLDKLNTLLLLKLRRGESPNLHPLLTIFFPENSWPTNLHPIADSAKRTSKKKKNTQFSLQRGNRGRRSADFFFGKWGEYGGGGSDFPLFPCRPPAAFFLKLMDQAQFT